MIDFIAYWLVRGVAAFFLILPIEAGLAIARVIGWLAAFTQIRVALAYANIKNAFPGRFTGRQIRRIVRQNYMNMLQNLVEMFWFPRMTKEFAEKYVTIPRMDRYFSCKEAGEGTALLTAHFGNWEYLNIRTCFLGIPIYVLVRDQKFPKLNGYLTRLRESHGSVMIRNKGAELREIMKAIKKNEMIGFLGDQQGGKNGVPVRFFARMTTSPAGPIQIPLRTGARAIPVFIVREHGPYHTVHVEPELILERSGDEEKDVEKYTQAYMNVLEQFISKYPDQWVWLHKRWKHNWTKRVVILSDGKAGHVNQSKAVFDLLKKIQETNPRFEFQSKVIEIRYRSPFHKAVFPMFAFLAMPFIQGRLDWLRGWFEAGSLKEFGTAACDIVISCGSSVLPLNYMLKRECLAKNIVIMKPSLPFSLFRADLNLVPEHDSGVKESEQVVLTRVTPSLIQVDQIKVAGEALRRELNLDHHRIVSVFLGGKTKGYDFSKSRFDEFLKSLNQTMEKNQFELLMTTSRRTGAQFENELKEKYAKQNRVSLLVIANEHNPEGIVTKMMGASDVLVVTEDSVSMISEGVASGKSVIVLRLAKSGLAQKHYRFQEKLASQGILRIATPENFSEILEKELNHPRNRTVVDDTQKIIERLQRL